MSREAFGQVHRAAASSLSVSDGSTTVDPTTSIVFTGATVTDGGSGEADVSISGSGSFDGALINDKGNTTNQVLAAGHGADLLMEHTAKDTGGYVDSSELGQKTLKIPTGKHGKFTVRANCYITPGATPPTSGHLSITLYLQSNGEGESNNGDVIEMSYPPSALAADCSISAAWTIDLYLDDLAWLEFFVFNFTNQSVNVFHNAPDGAPARTCLSIERIDDSSAS